MQIAVNEYLQSITDQVKEAQKYQEDLAHLPEELTEELVQQTALLQMNAQEWWYKEANPFLAE